MRWKLPWPKLAASGTGDEEKPDGWQRHIEALRQAGIPEPGVAVQGRRPATAAGAPARRHAGSCSMPARACAGR